MTPAITTTGLTKRYGKVTALAGATASLPEGRISALLGPNGAGNPVTELRRSKSSLPSRASARQWGNTVPGGTIQRTGCSV
jgi:fructose transport system ATP-binding protein